jgi:hypothetical protein
VGKKICPRGFGKIDPRGELRYELGDPVIEPDSPLCHSEEDQRRRHEGFGQRGEIVNRVGCRLDSPRFEHGVAQSTRRNDDTAGLDAPRSRGNLTLLDLDPEHLPNRPRQFPILHDGRAF